MARFLPGYGSILMSRADEEADFRGVFRGKYSVIPKGSRKFAQVSRRVGSKIPCVGRIFTLRVIECFPQSSCIPGCAHIVVLNRLQDISVPSRACRITSVSTRVLAICLVRAVGSVFWAARRKGVRADEAAGVPANERCAPMVLFPIGQHRPATPM